MTDTPGLVRDRRRTRRDAGTGGTPGSAIGWERLRSLGHRAPAGALASLLLTAAAVAAMLPVRRDLSVATTALVLVVPVVVGAAIGGFPAGAAATLVGFLVYDFVFIPPYGTLDVGPAQDWVALGVYVAVMVVVARVVARVDAARAEAQRRASELRRLFDLSELLVRNSTVPALLDTIVVSVRSAFDLDGAALLLPSDESGSRLELVASAGEALTNAELHALAATGRVGDDGAALEVFPLTTAAGPLGLLALRAASRRRAGGSGELQKAFANHLALALERAQLQEQAVRAGLLEEVDRLRRGLIGAVSHDLRTPLSTIKVASSALLDPDAPVSEEDTRELLRLVDEQADRLDRLVANLLDMTRIQAGSLELRRQPSSLAGLLADATAAVGVVGGDGRVRASLPPLPDVDVDPVLIRQVLVNLLDNALRHGPPGSVVRVTALHRGDEVEVCVTDRGGELPPVERVGLFRAIAAREAGGAGGLGLAIVSSFVEVHGGSVWAEPMPGGTTVGFTVPVAGAARS